MQHASSALGDEKFYLICTASQPQTLRRRLTEFTGAASSASSAEPSTVLGAPSSPLLHLPSSLSQSIRCAQVSAHQARRLSRSLLRSSKQAKDISELKSQIAPDTHASVSDSLSSPALVPTPPSPVVADISERNKAMSEEEQDVISSAASWDGDSLVQQETEVQEVTQEMGRSSEVASETSVTPPSSSV
ncbi:UNVERIFIED_CONTAM: hypothetical protein FKN15_004186 [Acipenser sinensis]